MKQPNILNTAELVTISILQQIKIELLEKKAEMQRNGRALEEPEIEDEPQQCDFIVADANSVTWEKLIDGQINLPSPLEELAKSAAKLDESPQAKEGNKVIQMRKPGTRARLNAWLAARGAWRVRKSVLEHEYARTKSDTVIYCNAIDFAIKIIDREIERQRANHGIKINDDQI